LSGTLVGLDGQRTQKVPLKVEVYDLSVKAVDREVSKDVHRYVNTHVYRKTAEFKGETPFEKTFPVPKPATRRLRDACTRLDGRKAAWTSVNFADQSMTFGMTLHCMKPQRVVSPSV
jgi:hypothetical protein